MRIGQLARLAGVTTKTVRYYESLGLITPDRLANGYRDYSQADVRLVLAVMKAGISRSGFTTMHLDGSAD
jgi:DNA-binding transcriptional MerR regulator